MIDLAEHSHEGYIPMKVIAGRQGISLKYLEQILPALTRNGMIEGLQRKGGGYRLTRTPEQYSVKCILELTEESLSPVSCLEPGAPSCPRMADCRTLSMWKGLDQTISDYLSGITVADLIRTDPDAGSYVI